MHFSETIFFYLKPKEGQRLTTEMESLAFTYLEAKLYSLVAPFRLVMLELEKGRTARGL